MDVVHSFRFPVISCKFPVVTKCPPVEDKRKNPVSQEYMAVHLGQCRACVPLTHEVFLEELHNCVYKLVYKTAQRYVVYGSDVNDLAQDCWVRIISKIHLFNPDKAKFTTWCWRVCSSVLNKRYGKAKNYQSHYVEMPEGLDENRTIDEGKSDSVLIKDICLTVEDLMGEYPDKKNILSAMFGDVKNCEGLPSGINLTSVSSQTGESITTVSRFYHDVVRPFFINRFKEV